MDTGDIIRATIAAEFQDVLDVEDFTRLVVRLLIAIALGALLGLEREYSHKSAGLRMHMLVAVSTTMFALMALRFNFDHNALSRVMQGVITGIGFLCAGVILKAGSARQVQGLITAASLWITTAIGLTVGLGYDLLAITATLVTLLVLRMEGPVERWQGRRSARKTS